MRRARKFGGVALTTATTAALVSACSGGGGLGDILGGVLSPASGDLVAEVRAVDTAEREIDIRTENGDMGAVEYDERTRVVYQEREYPVSALERGDVVAMRIQETGEGELYTDFIEVRQSVQERTGQSSASVEQVEGTVAGVDRDGGRFTLRVSDGRVLVVSLPWDAGREARDRFQRLRTGDWVRVEGHRLNAERLELERFV